MISKSEYNRQQKQEEQAGANTIIKEVQKMQQLNIVQTKEALGTQAGTRTGAGRNTRKTEHGTKTE